MVGVLDRKLILCGYSSPALIVADCQQVITWWVLLFCLALDKADLQGKVTDHRCQRLRPSRQGGSDQKERNEPGALA